MNTQTAITMNTAEHPAVVWYKQTYLPRVNGNESQAARELGMSAKVLSALAKGTYTANPTNQLAKLEEQRQRLSVQLAASQDLKHVKTDTMGRCWGVFEAAKRAHMANLLSGKSQIGKTTAAEAYKEQYPETTVLFRMPTRPTLSSLISELLKACKLGKGRTVEEGKAALCAHLTPRHVIIADEAHQTLTRAAGLDALDALRELYDRTGCGLTLIVTDIGAREFIKGQWAERLSQIERRGEWEILPSAPPMKDVLAIADAYGLPHPDAETWRIVDAMRRNSCFGQFCRRINVAALEAQLQEKAITWQDFIDINARMGRRPE